MTIRISKGDGVANETNLPAGIEAITEELVTSLGVITGLNFPPERVPAITARLRELHVLAAPVDLIELGDAALPNRFDPTWPEAAK
jgi:hypothetical protein